jgi:hypothetical protein
MISDHKNPIGDRVKSLFSNRKQGEQNETTEASLVDYVNKRDLLYVN